MYRRRGREEENIKRVNQRPLSRYLLARKKEDSWGNG
jgi:hypothetical protein